MSMFTLLNLAKAMRIVEDALYSEIVSTIAENKHEPTRNFFIQQINEVLGRTDTEERVNALKELKEIFEEGKKEHEKLQAFES